MDGVNCVDAHLVVRSCALDFDLCGSLLPRSLDLARRCSRRASHLQSLYQTVSAGRAGVMPMMRCTSWRMRYTTPWVQSSPRSPTLLPRAFIALVVSRPPRNQAGKHIGAPMALETSPPPILADHQKVYLRRRPVSGHLSSSAPMPPARRRGAIRIVTIGRDRRPPAHRSGRTGH
jgi:hypothetical protein